MAVSNYTVIIDISQSVDIEAETAEAAIEKAKSQLDPRIAAAAAFQIATVYTIPEEKQEETVNENTEESSN